MRPAGSEGTVRLVKFTAKEPPTPEEEPQVAGIVSESPTIRIRSGQPVSNEHFYREAQPLPVLRSRQRKGTAEARRFPAPATW